MTIKDCLSKIKISLKRLVLERIGASFVEAILALPVFLIFVFFLIDLARYFFIYIMLSYACIASVQLAETMPLETKTDSTYCTDNSDICNDFQDFVKRIQVEGEDLAYLVASKETMPSSATLVLFDHYFDSPQNHSKSWSGTQGIQSHLGFMRPGEKIRRATTQEVIGHSTRSFGENNATGVGWPGTGEAWPGILNTNPIEVRIELMFKPITPFFPSFRMIVREFGYRRTAGEGSSPAPVFATSTPVPPTNTPGPPPTSTPTWPGPTNTPQPTPTSACVNAVCVVATMTPNACANQQNDCASENTTVYPLCCGCDCCDCGSGGPGG